MSNILFQRVIFVRRVPFYSAFFAFMGFIIWMIFPLGFGHSTRSYAYRFHCQSNEKQLALSFLQYAQDNDNHLPSRAWAAPLAIYAKTDTIFHCPETNATTGTSDYFFNARFLSKRLNSIQSPQNLILLGDGRDDAPLDATLALFPAAWRTDKSSPAWRHLSGANYGFADGHVKWLTAEKVSNDFRMVHP